MEREDRKRGDGDRSGDGEGREGRRRLQLQPPHLYKGTGVKPDGNHHLAAQQMSLKLDPHSVVGPKITHLSVSIALVTDSASFAFANG